MKPKTKPITKSAPDPVEDVQVRAGLNGKFDELFGLLEALEKNTSEIRGRLFSEAESSGPAAPSPSSIDGKLAAACKRVASLCDETSKILTRF